MMFQSSVVLCFLCFNLSLASDTYRAGIIGSALYSDPYRHLADLDASDLNADILVLPSKDISPCRGAHCQMDNYDEAVKVLTEMSKHAKVYIVAHLFETSRCQNGDELTRSNLVFDRKGSIVAVCRKPVNYITNCTAVSDDVITFETDFGVTFGLLMEEDLVLRDPKALGGVRNFVLSGPSRADVPLLKANQFSSSWAYVNDANLITSSGIYAGKSARNPGPYADLAKTTPKGTSAAPVSILPPSSVPGEDHSHYTVKPVDLDQSYAGLTDTVCHGNFCCHFYVKSRAEAKQPKMHYGLAVFNGVRSFDETHNIGSQSCAVFACAGLYKRSCSIGLEINSTVFFKKISITGNFSTTANYPIILASDESKNISKFSFSAKPEGHITIVVENVENLHNIAIFGRDFSKDSAKFNIAKDTINLNVYHYIFNEDVQELFDYVWIRLRILIFVVSIYVLEMM